MKNNYVLVKFEANWADEFDVEGFAVMTEKEWEEEEKICDAVGSFSYSFGTNQYIEDLDSAYYSCETITKKEYDTLEKLGLLSSGFFPFPSVQAEYELEELKEIENAVSIKLVAYNPEVTEIYEDIESVEYKILEDQLIITNDKGTFNIVRSDWDVYYKLRKDEEDWIDFN